DSSRDVVEDFVPAHAFPLAAAARSLATHRVENPLRILYLIERRRTFRAVTPTAARMHRIAFELLDAQRVLVDVGEQPARRFAVETNRRDQLVAPRNLSRPRDRIELLPVVPAPDRRIGGQTALARRQISRDRMQRLRTRAHRISSAEPTV